MLLLNGHVAASTVGTVGLDELHHGLERPGAVVLDHLVVALGVQLEGWEAGDFGVLQLVSCGVHLGDYNVIVILEVFADFVVDGGELFTVSAPWGVEFDQHVLVGVQGHFVEVVGHQNLNWSLVPVLGDVLAEQVLLEFAVQEVGDEFLDGFGAEVVALWLVLGHVFLQFDQTCGRNFLLLHAEELEDPLVVFFARVDGDEQHLVAEWFGDGTGSFGHLFEVVFTLVEEQEEVGLDFAAEDLLGGVVVEFDDEGQGVGLDEFLDVGFGGFAFEGDLLLVEL